MFTLPCLSLVLVLHLMFNPNFSLHPFLCSKSVFWNKCYVTVSRHDSPTEKNQSWSHHTVKMGKMCLMVTNPMMQIKRITKITHPRICICVNLRDSHFLPPGCGRKLVMLHKKQPKTKKPCRNPWSWPRWPQRDRSWLAYPSCWGPRRAALLRFVTVGWLNKTQHSPNGGSVNFQVLFVSFKEGKLMLAKHWKKVMVSFRLLIFIL